MFKKQRHTPVQFTDKKARQADRPKDLPKLIFDDITVFLHDKVLQSDVYI